MFAALPPLENLLYELVAIAAIFLVLLAGGRWFKRRHRVEFGLLYILFCLSAAIWLPYALIQTVAMPGREGVVKHLGAATLLLGAFVVLALVRRFFWEGWFERQNKTRAPKFLSQLFGLVLVLAVFLGVLGGIYGKSIQGAIFGSTVVLGIIGFAMQDLLGNIIAGIALEIGKPFNPGDWLVVDGRPAEVIEVNWRSTRLRNNDSVVIDIPNKAIVGSTIVNLSIPTREHALRCTVGFDYGAAPNFVKDCLSRAAMHAPGVLANPAPKVFLKDFGESAVIYEIKFWIDDELRHTDILDAIRTNIWYEAQRNGIRIPFPIRTVQIERPRPAPSGSLETARQSARQQPFLQLLDEDQTDRLLTAARPLRFGRGETIIEQGEASDSMFLLLRGTAAVIVQANGAATEVATLRDGEFFGEMSLLTGEPRSATVIARTDCEMWEIGKEVLAELLQKSPALLERLSDLLAKRRLENEGLLASVPHPAAMSEKHREYHASFLAKLRTFFDL